VRYRFKGLVRSTGQQVEGHAHGQTPQEAQLALTEHGITPQSLTADPEAPNPNGESLPLNSAIDSAVDTAASQVPFDALTDRFKGKNVWVLDRDKIRKRVAQVVDQAIRQSLSDSTAGNVNVLDVREQVAQAISGLFKDNRNLTSQASNTSNQLDHQIKRIETMVHRAESVLAQMTIAISRMGSGFSGGSSAGPRRFSGGAAAPNEQNAVLLEIFKENLRLRGIEIDEPAATAPEPESETDVQPAPAEPELIAAEASPVAELTPLKQWTSNL
jgi:hypothetical protein